MFEPENVFVNSERGSSLPGLLCRVSWFLIDISGQLISPIYKGQSAQEDDVMCRDIHIQTHWRDF